MIAPPKLLNTSVVSLAKGVRLQRDEVRERSVLLAPERTIALDAIGVAILVKLDGERNLEQVIAGLAEAYNAPGEVIGKDVKAFLRDLADRRLLDIR